MFNLLKTGEKLELLTDIDMLLMVEKAIRGGIHHVIHRYAKGNNKYMKNYDKNTTSSYLMYLDAKKIAWMGNVLKMSCKWFSMGRSA